MDIKSSIKELELLMSIENGDKAVFDYIKSKPAIAQAYMDIKGLEIQKNVLEMQKMSLYMGKVLSDKN